LKFPSADPLATFVAFAGERRLAIGILGKVAEALWQARAEDPEANLLAFDRRTGQVVDLDLRGSEAEVRSRYHPPTEAPVRRGRPKLGVVSREVTLLPRHWDWLTSQPGGASATLRRLVEAARRAEADTSAARDRQEAAYRFMAAMAGDRPRFEEAARALFASDFQGLEREAAPWPPDIRNEVLHLLEAPSGRPKADPS
jgi:hypothetical protein